MRRLKEIATEKGFSPSSLNTYKNCPVQFYYEKVLRIKTPKEIEETIEASTLGTVIHKALEGFYLPFLGGEIKSKDLIAVLPEINSTLNVLFETELKNNSFVRGKNKLIYTVADQFLNAFIKKEIDFLKSGNSIEVVGLEKNLTREISVDGIDFPIKLIGNADRIDKVNGQLRIIDYKTGKVEPKEIQANDVRKITQETQFQKGFQLFLYAYMYKSECYDQDLEAGIVSFRALKGFFLRLLSKEKTKTLFLVILYRIRLKKSSNLY